MGHLPHSDIFAISFSHPSANAFVIILGKIFKRFVAVFFDFFKYRDFRIETKLLQIFTKSGSKLDQFHIKKHRLLKSLIDNSEVFSYNIRKYFCKAISVIF